MGTWLSWLLGGARPSARYFLTGVPAVGKTTTGKSGELEDACSYRSFGDTMLQQGRQSNVIKQREDLERLAPAQRQALQEESSRVLLNLSRGGPVLIDGHVVVDTEGGFMAGLPFHCISLMRLTGIIVLTATPQEVIDRRTRLGTKYARTRNSLSRIELHQQLTLTAAWSFAQTLGATLEVIENRDGQQDATAKSVRDFIGRNPARA